MYIQKGSVKIAVLSAGGKEAVVAMLGPGDFFGEHRLAGHPVRLTAAIALTATTVLIIPKDLVDQLFNSSEKRLARALLLSARYGKPEQTHRSAVLKRTDTPHLIAACWVLDRLSPD